MAKSDSDGSKSLKNGITCTRDFEIVEMSDLSADIPTGRCNTTTGYSVTVAPLPTKEARQDNVTQRVYDSFKRVPGARLSAQEGYYVNDGMDEGRLNGDRFYDVRAANARTANTGLSRDLKGRHLQMIAIGGSVGTGLFVASGIALWQSGPASMIAAYIVIGVLQYCTMQALGELAVAFPIAGSFSVFSTRFLDPSWGFAMGWNYAFQWAFALPLEVIAGAFTIQYWNDQLPKAIFVTVFLLAIAAINLFGIKGYGEAEFLFSTVKITAIVGFILLGIVINIGGTPTSGYIGGRYWSNPGPTNHGFKGFCSVLVTAAFSFVGTELVGLAAAEASNPRKSLPSAIKQVFWRIAIFYIVALLVVSLLVPYDEPRLLGGSSSVDATASPFVIAVESIGSTILPSVMNAIILVAVLSVGNSTVFGSSRTLAALAEQSHAPRIFAYVDRKGRPLVAVLFTLSIGFLAYLADVKVQGQIFDWLVAICSLSSLFTWSSICLCHIRFRKAWANAGNSLNQLPFKAQSGVVGSYIALVGNALVLASQFWMAVSPVRVSTAPMTGPEVAKNFFLKVMAVPIILIFYLGHKLWFKTRIHNIRSLDIDTGRSFSRGHSISTEGKDSYRQFPLWKKIYRWVC